MFSSYVVKYEVSSSVIYITQHLKKCKHYLPAHKFPTHEGQEKHCETNKKK